MSDLEVLKNQAQSVLDNPVFKQAFDNVLEGIEAGITNSAIADADERNQLGLQMMALAAVKKNIFSHIENFRMAEEE